MALPTLPANRDATPVPMTENGTEEFCPIFGFLPMLHFGVWISGFALLKLLASHVLKSV